MATRTPHRALLSSRSVARALQLVVCLGAAAVTMLAPLAPAQADEPSPSPGSSAVPLAGDASAPPPVAASAPAPVAAPTPPAVAASTSLPSPKRSLPDYGGETTHTSAGDAALWVPRVIFYPVYLVSEYVIRLPLGAAETAAERANLPNKIYDFFTFGPDHKAGFLPIALVDFGFKPSVGVYAFWDDAFFNGDDLRLHASTWGPDWLAGSLVQRIRFNAKDNVQLKLLGIHRPDYVYFGEGPTTLQSSESRYGQDKIDAQIKPQFRLWRSSEIDTDVGVRYVSFYNGNFGNDPSLLQQVAAGVFPLPAGYTTGYTAEYNGAHAALDTRRTYPASGSGVRIEAQVEEGNDVAGVPTSGWLKYQGAVGGFLDITHRRVVSLTVAALFSDPLGNDPVPFTELVSLGGDLARPGVLPMPGFFPGRMVDRSGAAATLEYRWPIGPWLDGSMQVAVGNVFGEHLDDFDMKLLRLSASLGIETDSSPDSNFHILIGMGTETFESGAKVDSFRLAAGVSAF
jgi:hypothetical protein